MATVVAIVSLQHDLHAVAVAHELQTNFGVGVELIEVDRLHCDYELGWRFPSSPAGWLRRVGGQTLDLSSIDTIWWRRSRSGQQLEAEYDEPQKDLIENDWRGSLRGALTTFHSGTWVSHPEATERAANKLLQLQQASRCGFRVPRTLVTNSPAELRRFMEECRGQVVAKPVVGTGHTLLFTKRVEPERLENASVRACPTIYQELIPGKQHLRVNCFGDTLSAAMIESERLDWRVTLDMPFRACELDEATSRMIRDTLSGLGLRMGVVDIKLAPDGEPVWFEVNPQGQFLFVEGLTKQSLRRSFARFLTEESAR